MLEQIGRYKILREIGKGGFGHVYLAYDPVMDRQVAVKVLTELDDPGLIARFRTEAIAAGNLNHRNIVTVYDFGEDQQRHYLVMQYLDGRDLQKIISAKEPLAMWQKVDIMSQIAEGLHCAHQSGVVHRDVKPANMIVLRDLTVKILDFGIARLTERDSTRVTKTGFMVGTVLYMAPEQLSDGDIDALSDIWSYGVIYYEILTGRHPFQAQDTASVMYRIMNQEPERVATLAPECPEALDRIVARLLSKRREDRYQSLADLQYDALPMLRELKGQQAGGLLKQAAGLFDACQYAEAQAIIRSVLDLDPGNAEAGHLREKVAQAIKRQAVRPKVDALLETAVTQAAQRNYRAAIQALEKARSLDPSDASLPERMEALKARQLQSEMAQRCLSEARQQLELQNFTEAFKQASNAVNADPSAADAAQLLDKIQRDIAQRDREHNIQRAVNRANRLLVMEVFDEALELLRKAAGEYPGSEKIEDLLRQTLRQIAEKEAREKLAAGVAAARNLLKKRAFGDAVAMLEGLNREFPAETELAGLLEYARDEQRAVERAAAIDRIGRQARTLTQNRDFDGAIRAINEGLEAYPGEESLMRVMQATLAAKAEHEKSRALQEGLARLKRMREQGAIADALEFTVALERNIPGSAELTRVREDLQREHRQIEERRLAAEREAAAAREIETLLAQSARRAEAGDWGGATRIVEDGLRRYPAAGKLKEAADDLRRKKSEAESLLAIQSACAEVKRSLAAGQLEAAAERLLRARRECPPDPRFDDLETQLKEAALRQERFMAAQEKIRNRSFPEAERELQAILDRDQQDTGARNLLASLARQRAAEERKQKYDARRAEAGGLLRERQFDAALQALEALLADFPGDPLVQEEIRVAREARERTARGETVARERAAAEDLLRGKNFAKAIGLLEDLQKRFPEEFVIGEDLKAARAAQHDHERKQAYAAGRAEAERLLAARDFQGAIARYQSLQEQFPNDPLLGDALQAAIAAQDEYRRKREAASGRGEAERLLRERRVPEAIALLQTLVEKFPEDIVLADDLRAAVEARDQAQRTQALTAGRAEAERLLRERQVPEAIALLQALVEKFPEDIGLADDLRAALEARDQTQRTYALITGRADAERLLRERRVPEAIALLQNLVEKFPEDVGLADDLRAAVEARDQAQRTQALTAGRAEAERLLRERRVPEAIALLQNLVEKFPEDVGLADDLRAAVEARDQAQRTYALITGRAEAEKLAAERSYEAAARRYEVLLKDYPGDRALAEGLAAVKGAQAAEERMQAYARGRGEAERLLRERRVPEAIALLQALVEKFPEDTGLADDLRAAEEARDQAQRTQALTAGRAEAERLLRERRVAEAIALLQNLVEKFPEDTGLADDLRAAEEARDQAQRTQALTAGRAEAERLLRERRVAEAIALLQNLVEKFPEDTGLADDLRAAEEARDQAQRTQALTAGRAEAERLLRERRVAEAIALLQNLVEKFPEDTGLADDLRAAEEARDQAQRTQALTAGRAEAERLLRERRVAEAIALLQNLVEKFPEDTGLADDLRAAEEARDQAQRTQALTAARAEAERLLRERQVPEAIALLQALVEKFPEDTGLADDLQAALEARDQTQRTYALITGRAEAERLLRERRVPAAIALLQALVEKFPEDIGLADDLRAAVEARDQAQRTQALTAGRAEAERLLRERQVPEAIALLQALVEKFPEDVGLADDLRAAVEARDQAQRTYALITGRAEAEKLAAERSYEAATRCYEALLKDYPGDRALLEGLAAVQGAQASEERKQAYARGRSDAERLAAARSFDAAMWRYRSLLEQFPHDTALEEGLAAVTAAKAAAERKQIYERGRASAEDLLRNKNFAKAIGLLEDLQKRFPEEFAIEDDLKTARAAQQDHERKQSYSEGRAEAERLLGARDFQGAIAKYQALQQQFPNDPLLADALEAATAAQEEYRRKQEVSRGRVEAERLLRQRQIPQAIALLQALVQKFPEDIALADDLRAAIETRDLSQRTQALSAGRLAAERLAAQRSYDGAIRRYEDLLKEYPGDRALTEGLAAVKEARTAEDRKQAYERGRSDAEKLAAARSFDAAIKSYRDLLEQYPGDTALEEGLAAAAAAKDAAERKQIYTRGRAAADDFLRSKNFAKAIGLLEDLQKRFPEEFATAEDLKAARAAKEDYERKRAHAAGRSEAERLLAARDFQGGIAKYQSLLQQFPDDPLLGEALKAAIAAQEGYQRKQEAARGRGEAERLLRERKVAEAIALLQALVQKFPEDIGVADDLRAAVEARDQTQRTQALTAGRVEAEKLAAGRSYDVAIRRYEALLKEYPGDRALMEGLAAVKDARAAEERKQAYARGRAEAEKLSGARSFDAAIKRYRGLLEEYPHDTALEEGLAAAVNAKDAAARKQIYTRGWTEAERLARELKFDAAIRQLDDLLGQFPHDRALEEYRESLVAAQQLRIERLRVDKQIAQLEKLYRKGDAPGVKEGAARLLAESETPRARELLEWAEGVLKRKAEPIPPDAAAALPASRSWLWLAAVALPAVVVIAGGLLYWHAHNQPALPSLSVAPDKIDFGTWMQGSDLPGPQSVTVKASGAWTFSSKDEWLVAKRVPDDQGSDVSVSIARNWLAAGDQRGHLFISSGGATKDVYVKLRVVEAPKPVEPPKPEPPKPETPAKTAPPQPFIPKTEPKSGSPPTQPVAPPADPPVTDQAVNCKADSYFGLEHGTLRWSGDLAAGGTVLLGRTMKTLNGAGGTWTGQALPGCEVKFARMTPDGAIAIEPPSPANNFSRLRVKNVSSGPLSFFSLNWEVK